MLVDDVLDGDVHMWQLVQDLNGQLSQPPTADESALLRRLIALRERLTAIASAKREHKFQLQLRSARRQSSASDAHRSPARPDPDSDDDDDDFLPVDADGTIRGARSSAALASASDFAVANDAVPIDDEIAHLEASSSAASSSVSTSAIASAACREAGAHAPGSPPVEVPFGADLVNWDRGDQQPALPATLFRDTHRFWAATNDTDAIVIPVRNFLMLN